MKISTILNSKLFNKCNFGIRLKAPEQPVETSTPNQQITTAQVIPPRITERIPLHQTRSLDQRTVQTESIAKYRTQSEYIREKLHKNIVDCGGNGDCLVYSVVRQVEEYKGMSNQSFNTQREAAMKKLRVDASKYAQDQYDAQESKLKAQLNELQKEINPSANTNTSTSSELNDRKRKLEVMLNDLIKEKSTINDLGSCGHTLDVCGEEGKYLSAFLKRPIVVFSEYNPSVSKEAHDSTIGTFFVRTPDGDATWEQHINDSSIPKDAIMIYHIGNDKGGHYQAIM